MLVLKIVLDIEFGVFFQGLGPMEVAGFLAPLDWNLGISRAIYDPRGVPIGLCTIYHITLEVRYEGILKCRKPKGKGKKMYKGVLGEMVRIA